jgi:hypothetical protein
VNSPAESKPGEPQAAFLALRSYVATARKHGMNPLVVLCQLFASRPRASA